MSNSTPPSLSDCFSPRATLAALGIRLQGLHLCGPVRAQVHMAPKTITPPPVQPWSDACIALLAGAHGFVELNTRLRSARGLPAACGRQAGAEQAVVPETLEAGPEGQVAPMHHAMDARARRPSRGSRHDESPSVQGWDAARTGRPCGPPAACATQGSWAQQRHRRGRPLGRVLATRDGAIVVDRRCRGTPPLTSARHPLGQATAQTRALVEATRCRTGWRLEAGGGSVAEVHGLLDHGDHGPGKDDARTRAQTLAASVTAWVDAPRRRARPVGWVTLAPTVSSCPVRRVAVRYRTKNGQWGVGVLIATRSPPAVIALTQQPVARSNDPTAMLLA